MTEEFNQVEMESRTKQEYVKSLNRKRQINEPRDAVVELMDELAIARIAVRELGDRLSKVEKNNTQVRNETLDEVVKEIEHLAIAFGVDTVHSFMVLVRSMKE
jgi:hypothetical protein